MADGKDIYNTSHLDAVDSSGIDKIVADENPAALEETTPLQTTDDPEVIADLERLADELTRNEKVMERLEKETEPEKAPEPKKSEPKKARPKQDSEAKPMTGVVTEAPKKKAAKPEPPKAAPTITPEQLAAQERHRALLQAEISDEILEKFAIGEYEEDLTEYRAEQRVLEDEIAFMRVKDREYRAQLEAAKWKTILVVKIDGRQQFFVDAWKTTEEAIDAIPGLDDATKTAMKTTAIGDLYAKAEARQRHCETGEVKRFESRDLAELKKSEWLDAWNAAKDKKAHSGGKSRQ